MKIKILIAAAVLSLLVSTQAQAQELALPTVTSFTFDVGRYYNIELTEATDGTGDLLYTLTGPDSSALPIGLSFDENTRYLSGILTTAVTAVTTTTLTYTVTDSASPTAATETQDIMLTINPDPDKATGFPSITGTPHTGLTLTATLGSIADNNDFEESNFTYQWLADGVAITDETDKDFTLTFAQEGAAITVEVRFTDNGGYAEGPLESAPVTATAALALPEVDNQIHNDNGVLVVPLLLPVATGGTPSYTYELTGTLPEGLSYDIATRTLSGIASKPVAAVELTYTVTDSASATTFQTFTVTVNAGSLGLLQPADQTYTVGVPITPLILEAEQTGRTGEITYTLTNVNSASLVAEPLPLGLEFDPMTRTLSGTPTMAGITSLRYRTSHTTSGDVLARSFTVTVTGTETETETPEGSVVDTINGFLKQRTTLILANQPNRGRRINRLQRGVGAEQLSVATGEITKLKPFEFNFLSLGSGNYKVATSLDQVTRAAKNLQLMSGNAGIDGVTTHERRQFDVWFEGRLNKFDGAGSNGNFGIAYLGADYLVSPDLLLGALVQYDQLSDTSGSGDTIKGKGWMAGPYVTARLRDNLYFDGSLAWGTSDNDISLTDTNATKDSFKSERWLTDVSLSGEFKQGNWIIRPNVSLSYMEDRQKAYQNTQGATVPGQTASQGQLRFGPNFSTRFLGKNAMVIEPSFTLDAIYSHAGTRGSTPSNATGAQDGWRARFESGLAMTTIKGTRFSLTGNYDGIGQSGFEAWGLGLNMDMKF